MQSFKMNIDNENVHRRLLTKLQEQGRFWRYRNGDPTKKQTKKKRVLTF